MINRGSILTYYRYSSDKGDAPQLAGRLYSIRGISIKNCSFKNITADELTKEIICQYGGNIENRERRTT